MKKRIKPQAMTIANLQEADAALAEIGNLIREGDRIRADLGDQVELLKAEAKGKISPLEERLNVLSTALEQFAVLRPEVFPQDRKSVRLTHGSIGFRRSTKVAPMGKVTWDQVLGRLRDLGKLEAIRVKEEVDKERLREWDDAMLAEVCTRRVVTDEFFAEPSETPVKEVA